MKKTQNMLDVKLPKRFYPQRAGGYILAFFPLSVVFYLQRAGIYYWTYILIGCFIWPHAAYLIAKNSRNPKEAEYRNLIIDSMLIGMTLPLMSFNLLVSALFFLMHGQNTMGAGGLSLFLKGSLAFIFGTLILIPFVGFHLNLEANLLLIASCLPVIIAYPMAIAFKAYNFSKNLNKAKNEINTQNEKLEEAHAETRKTLQETKAKEQEITNINRVVQTINSTLDLDAVLASVAKALQQIFSFNQIGILIIDEQKNELFFEKPYGEGLTAEQVEKCKQVKFPLKKGISICCNAALKNKSFYIPNINSEMLALFLPADRQIYEITRCKSYLFCPLEFQNQVIGVIVFGNDRQPFNLSKSDIDKTQRYVNQIASAINNARLFRDSIKAKQIAEAANTGLEQLANVDGLTQISNRRYFDQILYHEWKRAIRSKTPLSVVLIDIDFFKKYNDHYGHPAGDECLKSVAKALSKSVRRPQDLVARYGGEEFIALLPDTDIAGAKIIGESMRVSVKNLQIPHEQSLVSEYVTISVGIANISPKNELEPGLLVEGADKALYEAKKASRDTCKTCQVEEMFN